MKPTASWDRLRLSLEWLKNKADALLGSGKGIINLKAHHGTKGTFCVVREKRCLLTAGIWVSLDNNCQNTGKEFTGILKEETTRISMSGIIRALDNIMEERLWRPVKYWWYTSGETWWCTIGRNLTSGVKLVTSEAHPGLKKAIAKVLPGSSWNRCYNHFSRNVLSRLPRKGTGQGYCPSEECNRPDRSRGCLGTVLQARRQAGTGTSSALRPA